MFTAQFREWFGRMLALRGMIHVISGLGHYDQTANERTIVLRIHSLCDVDHMAWARFSFTLMLWTRSSGPRCLPAPVTWLRVFAKRTSFGSATLAKHLLFSVRIRTRSGSVTLWGAVQ